MRSRWSFRWSLPSGPWSRDAVRQEPDRHGARPTPPPSWLSPRAGGPSNGPTVRRTGRTGRRHSVGPAGGGEPGLHDLRPVGGVSVQDRGVGRASKGALQRMSIDRIGVVGCGLMGAGIAEVCARAGRHVIVSEVDAGVAERGHERILTSLDRAVLRRQAGRGGPRRRRCQPARSRPTSPTWPTASWWSKRWSRTRPPRLDVFAHARQGGGEPRRDPGLEHLVDSHHEAGDGHPAAHPGHRHALLQPGAGDASGRGGDVAAHLATRPRPPSTGSPPTYSTSGSSSPRTEPGSS